MARTEKRLNLPVVREAATANNAASPARWSPNYVPPPPLPFAPRLLVTRDFPRVVTISRDCIPNDPAPLTTDDLSYMVRERGSVGIALELTHPVADAAGHIHPVGEIIAAAAYLLGNRVVTIRHFVVAREWRRRGVGRWIALKLMAKLSQHHIRTLEVQLPETMVVGQVFARAMGWRAVKVLRAADVVTGEDHFLFRCRWRDVSGASDASDPCQGEARGRQGVTG